MFTLLMVCLAALFLAGFVKYTVLIHQAWAEEEGEELGLTAHSRGIGTTLQGSHRGIPVMLALSGRRVTEGEAKLRRGVFEPTIEEFFAAKKLFGSTHFKSDGVWADFPRSKAGDPPERYADALVTVAAFASTRTLEEIFQIEQGGEEAATKKRDEEE